MESEKVKEIKKALECCAECRCKDCPYEKGESVNPTCIDILAKNSLTLINELEKENKEKLKQFAERLKKKVVDKVKFYDTCIDITYNGLTKKDIDETLKEFVGVEE